MGLGILVLGLAVFLLPHVFVTRREARAQAIARVGEVTYRIGFSVLAIAGVALIAWGFSLYRATGWIDVWTPPAGMKHLTIALMWPATICLAAACIPGHIKRVLKYPLLVSIKIWALAHLLANGDLGSIILFGSFLAFAVFDRISLKRRVDTGVPRLATGGVGNDIWAVGVGTIVYLALGFVFHPVMIGVPVFGG
jgi:uncharacterized membrane protein